MNSPEPYPRMPSLYAVPLRWDGRNNIPDIPTQYGHLADPEAGPYHAMVVAQTGLGTYTSNIEDFFVVPSIDSIILTHMPSYPPPGPGETTDLYAIIKGKIDDINSPFLNYHYYRGPGIEGPNQVNLWDGSTFHFNDLPSGGPIELQQYFYENNDVQQVNLREWNDFWWGYLNYEWYVLHDERISANPSAGNQIGFKMIDTSSFATGWGHLWKTRLTAPENWAFADDIPYMRILSSVEINNTRNNYKVQYNISAMNENAHKVIFSASNYNPNDYDIFDWALTHIGVAYQRTNGLAKNPYRRIECSGLVTSTRIQDIGTENNQVYRIGGIIANDYDQGHYWNNIQLGVEEINAADIGRGDLITFKPWLPRENCYSVKATHVAIVEDAFYNERRGWFDYCCIVNARGWTNDRPNIRYGRVRYEDLIDDFRPTDNRYKYLEFR